MNLDSWREPARIAIDALTANPIFLAISILFGMVFAATALSLLAFGRAGTTASEAVRRCREAEGTRHEELEALQHTVTLLAKQLQELRLDPVEKTPPATVTNCVNIAKRSQAIRMHRHGDPPEDIASKLEIPRQEVDLLLKVHRIVLSGS